MASIEVRGTRKPTFRVVWRENGLKESERFATLAEAELYKTLVEASGGTRPVALDDTGAGNLARPQAGRPCSFEEWAAYWLATYSGPRGRTLGDYASIVRRVLVPAFGELDVAKISREDDGAWVLEMLDEGVSPKTISNRHGLFRQIMQAAVEYEPVPMRPRNPATANLPEIVSTEQRFLTERRFAELEDAMAEHYRPLIRFLVSTGLRFGEAAGLTVRHVRLLDAPPAIDVRQSLARQRDNTYKVGPPKSKASRRTIRLAPAQIEDLIPLVSAKGPDEFVFTAPRGGHVRHPVFWADYWVPAVKEVGLGGLRIHDLRHTHVAWLIAANSPLPVIQRRLGHSSIKTTIDRYGHLVPEADRSAVDAMERALTR